MDENTQSANLASALDAKQESGGATQTKIEDQKVPTPTQEPKEQQHDRLKETTELMKQKKEAARMLRVAQERQARIEAREKEIAEREAKFNEWDNKFKKNPLEAIKEKGYTYQDLTNMALNDEKPTPEVLQRTMEEQIAQLRKEQEERYQAQIKAEQEKAQAEQARFIEDFKSNINDFLEEKKDQYELINTFSSQDKVFSKIEEHFQETGKILSMAEASELIEKDLEDFVEMAMKTKKISSKFKSPEPEKKEPITKEQHKTLSNMAASSSAPSLLSPKTEKDRLTRALAALGN